MLHRSNPVPCTVQGFLFSPDPLASGPGTAGVSAAFCADFKFLGGVCAYRRGGGGNVVYITQTFLGFCQVVNLEVNAFLRSLGCGCACCGGVFAVSVVIVDYFPRNCCD